MTLDVVSGGRLRVAVDCCSESHERRAGVEWFSVVEARNVPGPVQQPLVPFDVAANGPRGMRPALRRAEGWVTMGTVDRGAHPQAWWKAVERAVVRFEDQAALIGGEPAGFRRLLDMESGAGPASSVEKVREDVTRAEELGFTDVVLAWPRASGPFAGDERVTCGRLAPPHGGLSSRRSRPNCAWS